MEKVSAIVTTHNRCELLKKAIDSVLNQTYDNIECIVVDDASNDFTQEYMKKYIDKGIKYIRIKAEDSKGGNYARNLGMKNATGNYIAYLDDDDQWLPKKTEIQVKFLEENLDVGFVTNERIMEVNNGDYYFKTNSNNSKNKENYSKKIFYKMIGVSSTMMFRKEILEEVGGFDENLKFWQDYELTMRLAQKSKVGFIDNCLTIYKMDNKDKRRLTNNLNDWKIAIEYINKKHQKLIKQLSTDEINARQILIYNDAISRCINCNRKKEIREYLKKIYEITHSKKDYIRYKFNIYNNPIKSKIKVFKYKLNNIENLIKEESNPK